eukprot:6463303-Amphidinium_carterae.1
MAYKDKVLVLLICCLYVFVLFLSLSHYDRLSGSRKFDIKDNARTPCGNRSGDLSCLAVYAKVTLESTIPTKYVATYSTRTNHYLLHSKTEFDVVFDVT